MSLYKDSFLALKNIMNKEKTALLIDSDALLHISYNGSLKTPSYTELGIPNFCVRQFIYSYSKTIKDLGVDDTVFVFDHKDPTFRHLMADNYKGDRKEKDLELVIQEDFIKDIIEQSGFKSLTVSGYEADDVLVSLANKMVEELGYDKVYIGTSDKDIYQCITDKIHIFNLRKKEVINKDNILEHFPVEVDKVVSYLCLVGDTADNVNGIEGVGNKRAIDLLNYFGDFISIFDTIHQVHHKEIGIPKTVWDRLVKIQEENDPIVEHNLKMITLVKDIELPDDYTTNEVVSDELRQKLDDLELHFIGDVRFYGRHK